MGTNLLKQSLVGPKAKSTGAKAQRRTPSRRPTHSLRMNFLARAACLLSRQTWETLPEMPSVRVGVLCTSQLRSLGSIFCVGRLSRLSKQCRETLDVFG